MFEQVEIMEINNFDDLVDTDEYLQQMKEKSLERNMILLKLKITLILLVVVVMLMQWLQIQED